MSFEVVQSSSRCPAALQLKQKDFSLCFSASASRAFGGVMPWNMLPSLTPARQLPTFLGCGALMDLRCLVFVGGFVSSKEEEVLAGESSSRQVLAVLEGYEASCLGLNLEVRLSSVRYVFDSLWELVLLGEGPGDALSKLDVVGVTLLNR